VIALTFCLFPRFTFIPACKCPLTYWKRTVFLVTCIYVAGQPITNGQGTIVQATVAALEKVSLS
jgi:hypothetical protein